MLSGLLQDTCLNIQYQLFAVLRKQLDLILGGLVGTEQTVLLIETAAVNRCGTQIVQTAYYLGSGLSQNTLGADSGVNIACLLYTSPSPRDRTRSRMPSSA